MIFFKYLFIFCIFSVVGWILEVAYRSIITKRFVNPGFMTGCVVPLYGFGAVILNLICNLFNPITSNYKIIIIFILSIILLSVLEYFTGYVLLKLFNLKLWDYSDRKLNINGFICLEFSLIWGFLSLVFYLFIYPWINSFAYNFASTNIGIFSLGMFMGTFLIDLCVSINLLSKLTEYSNQIKQTIHLEKIKLEARMNLKKKKIWNAIYPYISTNRFLRDKINKR